MEMLQNLLRTLVDQLDLDRKAEAARQWLGQEQYRAQRRLALAGMILCLALMVLLVSQCSGGPQVHP